MSFKCRRRNRHAQWLLHIPHRQRQLADHLGRSREQHRRRPRRRHQPGWSRHFRQRCDRLDGSRLSLISQTGGAAGQITIDSSSLSNTTAGSAVSLTAGQPGQDALFTVDGIQIASATNTVTGAISGVTMQLLGKSTAPVQVEIDNDTASVTNALSTMVKDYNAVVSALTAQEGKDATATRSLSFGSPIISQLQQMLSSAMTTPSATSLTSPTQVGLSLNSNGTLSLNTDQLSTALNSNFSGVQTLFQNTNSFGLNLAQAVNNAGTGSTKSILTQAQNANSSRKPASTAP